MSRKSKTRGFNAPVNGYRHLYHKNFIANLSMQAVAEYILKPDSFPLILTLLDYEPPILRQRVYKNFAWV